MLHQDYSILQGQVRTLSEPSRIRSVGGDNGTKFYLRFLDMPPGQQWVFPFTYGFMLQLPLTVSGPVRVTANETPPGFPPAAVDTTAASITAFDESLPYSAGHGSTPAQQWSLVGAKVFAAGADSVTTNVVPPTTKTIVVMVEATATAIGGGGATTLVGVQTGTLYLSTQNPLIGMTLIPVNGVADSTYTLSTPAGSGQLVGLYASDQLSSIISPLPVQTVSVSAQTLGDPGAPILLRDQGTETLIGGPPFTIPLSYLGGVMASFKAAAGALIAQVGALGAFLVGTNVAVNPLFGQATLAGDFLVAWVTAEAVPACVTAGWAQVTLRGPESGQCEAIWAKPNCGAAEAPPQFTSTGAAGKLMTAQLGEFSGVAIAAPTDRTTSGSVAAPANQLTLTLLEALADSAFGDLVVMATRAINAGNQAAYTDGFNNGASAVQAGSASHSAQTRSSSNSYGIIPTAKVGLPLAMRAWDYDLVATSTPAAGAQATVTLAASPGRAYRAAALDASIVANAATASNLGASLIDGAAALGSWYLGTTAAIGSTSHMEKSGCAYKGTINTAMIFRFSAGAAGNLQAVTIGAYLQ